jgi:hypothetical protein
MIQASWIGAFFMANEFWLSNEQWLAIEPCMPTISLGHVGSMIVV